MTHLGSRSRPGAAHKDVRTLQVWPPEAQPSRAPNRHESFSLSEASPAQEPCGAAALPNCGETVGGHCVLRTLLGEGAFGRVFAAEDEETGQQVALKVVSLRRYPREYAEHELRVLAAIAHPNVVQLNEHGVEANAAEPYLWYTMPLYKGEDLARSLQKTGQLSLARAHAVFTRIAGGVCEMHTLGLRHQDIKPDNIYLATMPGVVESHPVLLDLGGAAREDANRPLVATFPFAAPEQTEALIGGLLGEDHPPLSGKVDVYALAATLLFSLIGRKFWGHDIAQRDTDNEVSSANLHRLRETLSVVHALRAQEPLPEGALTEVSGRARERLSAAFTRWLSLDPSARPSAQAFLAELGVLLEWDAELTRRKTARHLRQTVLRVAGALSLAASVGGLAGYHWHKRTMGEAQRATSRALQKADRAVLELDRASTNLDTIARDPRLGAVEKAQKITALVGALEARTDELAEANTQLEDKLKAAVEQARLRAQDERATFTAALLKAEAERDAARSNEALSEAARWKAEASRDQAHADQAAADRARLAADRERFEAQQEKAAAEAARARAATERERAELRANVADEARRKAEAERDQALSANAKPAASN